MEGLSGNRVYTPKNNLSWEHDTVKSFISSLPLCPPSQSSPNHLRHLLVGQTHKSTWPKNLVPESAARTEHLGRSRISKESMEKHGAKQEHSGKWFLRSVTHRRMTHHWKYPDCLYGRFITGHGMTPLWSQFQCSQLWMVSPNLCRPLVQHQTAGFQPRTCSCPWGWNSPCSWQLKAL